MTVHAVGVQQDRQPGSGPGRLRGTMVRVPVRTVIAVASSVIGVAGSIVYQRVTAADTSAVDAQAAEFGDVYLLALRINGVCHHLRMDSSSAASRLIPLWAVPADRQEACDVSEPMAATLYGIDPAKAG